MESKEFVEQLTKALPPGLTPARITRQVVTLCRNNPKLMDCSQQSIMGGLMQAAELGLEMTGPLGHAFLIPRFIKKQGGNIACFQLGYKGIIALAYRSPQIKSIEIRTVYEAELPHNFRISYGTNPGIEHVPILENRGEPVGYYCVVHTVNGGFDFEFMTKPEVERHRDQYAKGLDRSDSPWNTAFDQMAGKTVFLKMHGRLPLTVQAQTAFGEDQEVARMSVAPPAPALKEGTRTQQLLDSLNQPITPAEPLDGDPEPDFPADYVHPTPT